MTNPTAGHTSATGMGSDAQGLRDGDGLTSPSLTNLYEGLHGNGIMRLGDGAKGDSLRNSVVANTPGFIQIGSSQGEVKVYGGYCALDGVLYKFANGPGSHETFIVGTTGAGANHSGDLPSVPSSNADVFIVVYLVGRSTPEAHLMYEMGTPAAPTSGTPLLPNRFLSSPSISGNTDLNHQTTVLGVIRYSMTGGAANVTASLGSPVIHDRRAFLRKSPLYLTPMTKGAIGNVDAANALTNPDSFFASPEEGDLTGSTFGAIWQTHREDVAGAKHGIILAALPKNLDTTPVTGTYVLGPDRLETITTSGNITFTFDEANIWVVTTDAARTINPTGTFSAGHVVDIYHKSGAHNLHFDSTVGGHGTTPINVNIGAGESARFVYDGDNWHQVIAAASSSSSSSGASGLVQLSNGAGGFTSDTTLSYDTAANELTVDGKLTVTGLIDPTGLELTPQASNPAAADAGVVDANTLWLDSGASNRLKQGASNVIRATDSVTELSDVSNAGSGIIISDAERTKLTGIETAATADQTDAEIRAAVESATDSNVFTDADHTKLNGIESGATADQTDAEIRAAVEAATDSNVFTDADHTKLDGIAASATANDTDANLRDRATHTGVQTSATISDFNTAVAAVPEVVANSGKVGYTEPDYFIAHVASDTTTAYPAKSANKVTDWTVTNTRGITLSSNTFTVTDAGIYDVQIQLGFVTGSSNALVATSGHDYQIQLNIYKNGSVYRRHRQTFRDGYTGHSIHTGGMMNLAATDTLEIYFYIRDEDLQSSTNNVDLRGSPEFCWWTVRRVGDA